MSSITPEQKNALITAITGLVTRLQSSALTEQQANTLIADYVTGLIADDATASAGVATDELASIRGAYLAAKKALEDELAGSPAGLQTLADIGTAVEGNQNAITTLQTEIAGLSNAFKYRTGVDGGATEGEAFDLETLTNTEAGDYYKVTTSGWFVVGAGTAFEANLNDGLVFNDAGDVDIIDNTNSTVEGTLDEIEVTGSTNTGFTVALSTAFKARLTTVESTLNNHTNSIDTLIAAVDVLETHFDNDFENGAVDYQSIVLTDVNALEAGLYTGFGTGTYLGLDAEVGAATVVPVTITVTPNAGSTANIVNFSVTHLGKVYVKAHDGTVAVDTDATVYPWTELGTGSGGAVENFTPFINFNGLGANNYFSADPAVLFAIADGTYLGYVNGVRVGLPGSQGSNTRGNLTIIAYNNGLGTRGITYTFSGVNTATNELWFSNRTVYMEDASTITSDTGWSIMGSASLAEFMADVSQRLGYGGTPSIADADVVSAERSVVDTFPAGLHVNVNIKPDAAGVDGADAVSEGKMTTVVSGASGSKTVAQTYVWAGKQAIRTGNTADEDTENVTVMQWSPWHIAAVEIEELYDLLTDAFNNAAT